APLARMLVRAAYGSSARQVAEIPWTPPESPFGHTAPKPKPAVKNLPAARKLEEHFETGFDQWTSGVSDWVVDVAGVRTGSLALFQPSMDLADYDLEFLARIENQSVSWVFRAADLNDYYIASIGT